MPLIAEGLVTTLNENGTVNVSPMGPTVDRSFKRIELRPFATSNTYRNLTNSGFGVFHVSDDVELLARAAVGGIEQAPETVAAQTIPGRVLADACRWYEFRVENIDDSAERISVECTVTYAGRIRDFFGFNRAKHAVLEAAILATRLHILPKPEVDSQLRHLRLLVEKTGGDQEERAFQFLQHYIDNYVPRRR